tara:strand:+ start:1933 stop:4275 length:2343 start_codon:yes stop_codon:yes gene_type:complete
LAEYDHLPLRRVGETQDRRRVAGFGRAPPRDRPAHGAKIAAEAAAIIALTAAEPELEGIDPSLILMATVPGFTSDNDWRLAGLTVVAHEEGKVIILFGNDIELTAFRERVAAYQAGPTGQQQNAPYSGFFDSIDDLGVIEPADRIGKVLRDEGYIHPAAFPAAVSFILDVELWRPTDEFVLVYIKRAVDVIEAEGGEVLSEYHGSGGILLRVSGSGTVFEALAHLKEVSSIDRPPEPDLVEFNGTAAVILDVGEILAPPDDAICIGIVDSGVNNGHPLLENVVVGAFGLGDLGPEDEKGHGTQVAGIAAYGDVAARLAAGQFNPRFKIASARVVNASGHFEDKSLAPTIVRDAIIRLNAEYGCRIINMSLGDPKRLTGVRASLWAQILDDLARELDIVIVVSAGNSDREHLTATYGDQIGRAFPGYLSEPINRLVDPAGAVNVVTVGALAHGNGLEAGDQVEMRPISGPDLPAPFTRSGLGVAGAFKPDLVDYGGTAIFDGLLQGIQDGSRREVAGVLSLNHDYTRRLFASASGTSLAAPLVAYKAASILEQFPGASANFIRALLALSADLPRPSRDLFSGERENTTHGVLGHGQTDLGAAIFSDDNRVILTAEDSLEPDKFAIFEIPIPADFHSTAGERSIEVALAFAPPVRRSRLDYAGVSMQFDLVRGKSEDDVLAAYRALDPDDDDPASLEGRYKCAFAPKIQLRKTGTLQRGRFTMKRNVGTYGETYYLVVRCVGKWAANVVDEQSFAVAVMIRHSAGIALYAQIEARVRLALRV